VVIKGSDACEAVVVIGEEDKNEHNHALFEGEIGIWPEWDSMMYTLITRQLE